MLISEYISRLDTRTYTLFRITSEGKGYYIQGDTMYTREEFYRKYSLPVNLLHSNKNADKSKSWLYEN